jgi:large subunit ribosomal protein L29
MKMAEVNELKLEELVQKREELEEKLYHLRAQKQLGKLEKPHQLRYLRRDIARLRTLEVAKDRREES